MSGFCRRSFDQLYHSLTAEVKVPLVLTNAAGVQLTRLSPYVVRTSFTLWQQGYPIGKWAAEQGWRTGYTEVRGFIPGSR